MIQLTNFDKIIIFFFFFLVLAIGFAVSKKSSQSSSEYFLSGRTMPWWLLGLSMVATTFSTDTPNLVTDIVRQNGVSCMYVSRNNGNNESKTRCRNSFCGSR